MKGLGSLPLAKAWTVKIASFDIETGNDQAEDASTEKTKHYMERMS
jgi:hypothetical protein